MELLSCIASLTRGSGHCNSCNALPRCLGAVGSGTPLMHCLTAWGQWAMQLLHYSASLPRGNGECNSCNALPHHLGAVGSATPARHCLTAWGQWGVQLLQCTATPPGGDGQWNSCNARAHRLRGRGVVPHCPQAVRQCIERAVLLQCSATLSRRTGQGN